MIQRALFEKMQNHFCSYFWTVFAPFRFPENYETLHFYQYLWFYNSDFCVLYTKINVENISFRWHKNQISLLPSFLIKILAKNAIPTKPFYLTALGLKF